MFVQALSCGGSGPEREFPGMPMDDSAVRHERDGGIFELKLLAVRVNRFKFVSFDREAGSVPIIPILYRLRYVRPVRSPIAGSRGCSGLGVLVMSTAMEITSVPAQVTPIQLLSQGLLEVHPRLLGEPHATKTAWRAAISLIVALRASDIGGYALWDDSREEMARLLG